MDLDEAADELYALRPDGFIRRRGELAAEARAAGDKALAAQITKLPRPRAAAWLVNVLVRHDPDQVEQLLELGVALRAAQHAMAAEDLRELGRQRRRLTAAMTERARALAGELGQRVAEPVAAQVQETLHAAMADEEAASAVRSGMLVRPLASTGLTEDPAGVGSADAVALPSAVRRTPPVQTRVSGAPAGRTGTPDEGTDQGPPRLKVVPDDSSLTEEAEAALARAEAELADSQRRLERARRKVDRREAKGLQLQAQLEELRGRVEEVERRIAANEDELTDAEDAREAREEAVEEARAQVDRARAELRRVRGR